MAKILDLSSKFLDTQGLTKTSAQYIKDLAGHAVETINASLNSVSFCSKTMQSISSDQKHLLKQGWNLDELQSVSDKLKQIGLLQSLQAWLGEAIRSKTRLEEIVNHYDFNEWLEDHDVHLSIPSTPSYLTEEDWLNSLSVKERNHYLHLQTMCAVYGKYIHPKMPFDKARKELQNAITSPTTYSGEGQDIVLESCFASIPIEAIDSEYFKLQQNHRQYQAEFNGLRHQFELKRDEKYAQDRAIYEEAREEYNKERTRLRSLYDADLNEYNKTVRDLKIIIPNDLKEIYDHISKLGK